tara:strand:+ start:42 stop:743 length:702 start_codon:yes stop_codon:yes gene_type:complete
MAISTFSHTVLSAVVVSDPQLALGSGYTAAETVSNAVSLTAGSDEYNSVGTGSDQISPGTNPIPNPGIGVPPVGAQDTAEAALSGVIGVQKFGAIGGFPVAQLFYNPPIETGVGNLNSDADGRATIYDYELESPDTSISYHRWRPHRAHHGNSIVSSSISGIEVALRTGPQQAGYAGTHQHHDSHPGIEVRYCLGDPNGSETWSGKTLSAGLSSDHLGFVGPEHARRRMLGYL